MTTATEAVRTPFVSGIPADDHRGRWLPTTAMVAARFMELRRRRGLMIVLAVVTIGIPTVFLVVRLLAHAFAPNTYGPAGGYDIFTALVAGVLYIFGFIVAAALGCTAGSIDLQEGVFRHLVVTGRSRVATYFARIPAGLGIIVPLVAIGFSVVCVVCSFAAPTQLSYDGLTVPAGMTRPALVAWAGDHYSEVLCRLPYREKGPKQGGIPIPCGPNGTLDFSRLPPGLTVPSTAKLRSTAKQVAAQDYADYHRQFLSPPIGLMVRTGLWVELEAVVGFTVGLGLGSLIGQRTIAIILMVVLEVILTPIFLRAHIPYMVNFQRAIVGVATIHLRPSAMPAAFGGGGPPGQENIVAETRTVATLVVLAWIAVFTTLGAWRMATRDA